jgi:hypothetical protein
MPRQNREGFDGPSVRRLKDAQGLGLYQPDAKAEREQVQFSEGGYSASGS